MVLMLEEIIVEFVAIAAPIVALACLIYLIALTFLERRELRRLEAARRRAWESNRSAQRLRRSAAAPPATSSTFRAQT
ncbi:MAG: hypothetical protein NTW58_03845 [Actinobacteria bacterium]|nr:hypothetical protein [Actinomycetota bacterium]